MTNDRLAAELAALEADRRPVTALHARLAALAGQPDAASSALGAALFESFWYTLSPFADEKLPALAASCYDRLGNDDGMLLMAGLAVQLQRPASFAAAPFRTLQSVFLRTGRPDDAAEAARRGRLPAIAAAPGSGVGTAPIAAQAAAIARDRDPGHALLHALTLLDHTGDHARAAPLFESTWYRVPPLMQYWIYHRMSDVYATLGRGLAAMLTAAIAVQIEPANPDADVPYRRVLAWFRAENRPRDAAMLCRRRAMLCPTPALLPDTELAGLRAAAGPLPPPATAFGRREIAVRPADIRPASPWPCYGPWPGANIPEGLRALRSDMHRRALQVSVLDDAEVLLHQGSVAVYAADGQPQIDLSLRDYPSVVRQRLDGNAKQAVEELDLDEAVLISDEFFTPNLCHFMLDQASRLAVYRSAGVRPANTTVIGPQLGREYQRLIGTRLGIGGYLSVDRRARVRVRRLWVSSNCRRLQHPAHWGTDWAMGVVREQFDLTPHAPPRRLLISRADSPYRRIANAAEVEAVLKPLDFDTVIPGPMPFLEQVALFRDATHIVAPHGQALANTLFCAPGTHVLETFHPLSGTWAYAMIAPPLGLRYASLIGRDALSDAPEHNDPAFPQPTPDSHSGHDMRVDIDALRRWLKDIGLC